ncbi:hypothetical protein ACQ86N_19460 [Puia sp. P3]
MIWVSGSFAIKRSIPSLMIWGSQSVKALLTKDMTIRRMIIPL